MKQIKDINKISKFKRLGFMFLIMLVVTLVSISFGEILLRVIPIPGIQFNASSYNDDTGATYYPNAKTTYRSVRGDFIVRKATNGNEAILAARHDKFDIALLDLKMPGIDGKQVLDILKKEHKYLEVIILTGHGSLDSAVECTKLGAFGYLPKPYELEKLIKILKNAYEERMLKKFKSDQNKMDEIMKISTEASPLSILRKLREMDDEEK